MKFDSVIKFFKPYFWRLIFTISGLGAAVSFLTLGFGKTLVILICCGIGYAIGIFHDKDINFLEWLQRLRNRW